MEIKNKIVDKKMTEGMATYKKVWKLEATLRKIHIIKCLILSMKKSMLWTLTQKPDKKHWKKIKKIRSKLIVNPKMRNK